MPRAGLDPDAVVAAAEAIADADGLGELTLSRLASQLGVRTPSLYAHVAGLDDLRRRLATRAAAAMAGELQAACAGRAGRDALVSVATAYRRFALAHPGGYAALQRAGDAAGAEAERVVDVVLAVLRGYALTGADAIHATRAIRAALHGFVTLETGGGFGLELDLDDSFARLVELLDRGLAPAG